MKKGLFKKFRLLFIGLAFLFAVALFIPAIFNGGGTTYAEAASIKDTNINYNRVEKRIEVKDKKILDVTELITVTFAQSNINVGLSRNISHTNKITRIVDGKTYVKTTVNKLLNYSVLLRKGLGEYKQEYAFTETDNDYYYILTGKDNDFKEAGTYTYRIHYEYEMGEDFISKFDDFTFDIMDYGFRSPVDEFRATIKLPSEFLNGKDISEVLSFRTNGMSPLSFEDVSAVYDAENFKITCKYANLGTQSAGREGRGLTMQLILPQGYFHTSYKPNAIYKVALSFCIIAAVGVAAVILGLRYRKKPITVTEFNAPDNMSPMDVARIYRGKILGKDFASLVIHWASMGLLSIRLNGRRHVILTKLKNFPSAKLFNEEYSDFPADANKSSPMSYPTRFTKYERDYFNAIFSRGGVFDTKKDKLGYHDHYRSQKIHEAVTELKQKEKQQKIKTVTARVTISVLSALPLLFTGIWASGSGMTAFPIFFILLFPLIAINVFLYVPMPLWFKIIWCALFGGAPMIMIITMVYSVYDIWYLAILAPIIFIAGHIGGLFVTTYPHEDEDKLGKILGFKDFLLYAELDKLNQMVEANPDYYYDILPYCYVFGITKKMQKRFEAISSHARLPDYFEGHTASAICHCMTSSMSHIGGGFSSSGGGGSGGGGGGGGGGGSSGGGGGGGGCGGR